MLTAGIEVMTTQGCIIAARSLQVADVKSALGSTCFVRRQRSLRVIIEQRLGKISVVRKGPSASISCVMASMARSDLSLTMIQCR